MSREAELRHETTIHEIRVSPAAWWNVLDFSGATQASVMLGRAPWRAMALTAGSVILLTVLELGDPYVGVALLLGACIGAVEVIHRRDFVTRSHLVRQSGLLGRRRLLIPLVEIERVEYFYPRFVERFHAGDVEVTAKGRGITFIGVHEPEELAALILRARERLPGMRWQSAPHNNELQRTSQG